ISMLWWGRYDSHTALRDDGRVYNTKNILDWLAHPSVAQRGALTPRPDLLDGAHRLLYSLQTTNKVTQPVEGHLPGASEETLTKMKLFGVSADHEPITGEEVFSRLEKGYHVSLRYSSIRPDLPHILTDLARLGLTHFDDLSFTTDASTPSF